MHAITVNPGSSEEAKWLPSLRAKMRLMMVIFPVRKERVSPISRQKLTNFCLFSYDLA